MTGLNLPKYEINFPNDAESKPKNLKYAHVINYYYYC